MDQISAGKPSIGAKMNKEIAKGFVQQGKDMKGKANYNAFTPGNGPIQPPQAAK